jgi:integrase
MKTHPLPQIAVTATLQSVLDRLAVDEGLSETRKRDLRSAVISFAKLVEQPPATIPLDIARIRMSLDSMTPGRAQISAKRWANLRSDLTAALRASGLQPMLNTRDLKLDPDWSRLLAPADRAVRYGLSRFARWASQRRIRPEDVDHSTIDRFVAELGEGTVVRKLHHMPGTLARTWNKLVAARPGAGLRFVSVPNIRPAPTRISWNELPGSFPEDVERMLIWASCPDPLEEGARARPLAPQTLRLRRAHIHSAVSAAAAAGIPLSQFTSLASLLERDTFRALLRHRWSQDGCRLSAYTHGMTVTLIVIASEWADLSADEIAALKVLRSKLGPGPSGLTEKNKSMLRKFDDPRLITDLIQLPDRLWATARRRLPASRRAFVDLQTALAIDLLIHVPMRMQNLACLNFQRHLHWPQGRRKPAIVTLRSDETKNHMPLEFEIPAGLAERLQVYRNEIAPTVIGKRPDPVFVSFSGKPRKQDTIKMTITKTIRSYLGVKLTPHQFRHLAAKIILDDNPGAYELVRQLLGHKNLGTTTTFYAGIDTRRAGRAHADLVIKLRESELGRRRRQRPPSRGQG